MGRVSECIFKVGISPDFLNKERVLSVPDIGLSLFDVQPHISYEFIDKDVSEYLPNQLVNYDVLLTLKPRITAQSLRGLERLCAIGRCGVGYDNVDLRACTEHDIAVYITPDGVIRPMASSIVLLVLAFSHRLVVKDRMVRRGEWKESTRLLGREPRNRVIGTVGLGNIASEVVRLLQSFNIGRFLAFDPYVDREKAEKLGVSCVPMNILLQNSDYVLVNCPLSPETRHLLGEHQLELMKPTAVLINTARGAIVDQDALIRALKSRVIAGAALDVFEDEPLSQGSPLLAMDNVILTSHSIGWTEELFRDIGRLVCQGAIDVSNGSAPRHIVNRDVLDRPGFKNKLKRYALGRRFA